MIIIDDNNDMIHRTHPQTQSSVIVYILLSMHHASDDRVTDNGVQHMVCLAEIVITKNYPR